MIANQRARRLAAAVGLPIITLMSATLARAQVEFQRMRGDGGDIRMTKIADGIYQFMTMRDSYVRQLNSVAIVCDADVLVFDTGTRPSSARSIIARIREITPKPVRFVVNSHWHPDHWLGNVAYADAFRGVDFIASTVTADSLRTTGPAWTDRFAKELATRRAAWAEEVRTGRDAGGAPVDAAQRAQDSTDLVDYASLAQETLTSRRVSSTVTYSDTLTLRHGGREFRFMSVMGDAEGTTMLWMPREKVLITGDVVSYPIPYVVRPVAHAETLRALMAMDVVTIIPGHGPAFHDKNFLALELRLFDAVRIAVEQARSGGVTNVEELQRIVTVEELRRQFTHDDPDLDARYRARVKAMVGFIVTQSSN